MDRVLSFTTFTFPYHRLGQCYSVLDRGPSFNGQSMQQPGILRDTVSNWVRVLTTWGLERRAAGEANNRRHAMLLILYVCSNTKEA